MTNVWPRVSNRELPVAVHAEGAWIETADGRRYLDGAGGAIVVNVGHGDPRCSRRCAPGREVQYVHGTMFTTRALETYADEVATVLPMDDARIYPVSGGSEAVETAMKMARAYHLARGEDSRTVIIGRGELVPREHARSARRRREGGAEAPYEPWLGRFPHVGPRTSTAARTRRTRGLRRAHASKLAEAIGEAGPETSPRSSRSPSAGATLAARFRRTTTGRRSSRCAGATACW